MEKDLLLVLTKPARPGKVKTRLIGALSPEEAAALHAALAGDVLERLDGGRYGLRVAWALEAGEPLPPCPHPALRQRGADLGARLFAALAEAARDAGRVAAVGTDCPELDVAIVEQAFARLDGADLVLAPAADGGYVLIALRRSAVRRELFDGVPWSTGGVLAATLARAARLGLAVELLPVAHDVDTPADLERLASRLASGDLAAPRTAAWLAAWRRPAPAALSA